jgi:predicted Zn-dependent protease
VITGSIGGGGTSAIPQATVDLGAAERTVYQHPRSYAALISLGTAYLQNGRVMEADLSFQAAMHQDPRRPDAPTLHAMLLGAIKQYRQALALLSRVEREHPAYARAWLMDGILSSHVRADRRRALGAWLRFLLLAPQSDIAPTVRQWISRIKR